MRMALSSLGSATCTTWNRRVSAGSFSMYFLYSAQVVAAIVRSVPRARAGFSRFAASPVPAAPPAPIERVGLVDEQDDRLGRRLHLVDHLSQPVLELALHARAGLQQADVERVERHVLQAAAARRLARAAARNPSTTAVLPTPASPVRIGLFCRRRIRMSTICRISSSRPMTGSISPFARPLGEVRREPLQRLLLAHLRRRHGVARLARRRQRRAVGRAQLVLRRAVDDLREVVGQRVGLDALELTRDRDQRIPQRRASSECPTIRWPVRTRGSPNISVA